MINQKCTKEGKKKQKKQKGTKNKYSTNCGTHILPHMEQKSVVAQTACMKKRFSGFGSETQHIVSACVRATSERGVKFEDGLAACSRSRLPRLF